MTHASPRIACFVWLFLVIATLAGAWLAEHHALAGQWTVLVIMLIAALKGRAIILHFMAMKGGPWIWRLVFELWLWASVLQIVIFWSIS